MKLPGLRYDSPHTFTLKQRMQLAVFPPAVTSIYRALAATANWDVRNPDKLESVIEQHGVALLGTWHEATGGLLCRHRGRNFHSTASFSFDGELAARICHHFGAETVRGSSSNGGSQALEQMELAVPHVPVVGITMDGPRGPRRVAKPGLAILAARTGKPIVPNACVIAPCWQLRSWDKFMVPKPFCKIVVDFADPIAPPATESPEDIEATRAAIEQSLNQMTESIEAELGIG